MLLLYLYCYHYVYPHWGNLNYIGVDHNDLMDTDVPGLGSRPDTIWHVTNIYTQLMEDGAVDERIYTPMAKTKANPWIPEA